MSSTSTASMPIPGKRKQEVSSASASSSPSSPSSFGSLSPRSSKGKGRASDAESPSTSPSTSPSLSSLWELSARRPSLMGSSLSKSSYTVVNLSGHREEGPTRLVSCVKSSQGFDWNQELFLPSYASYDFDPQELELRADPVMEVWVSDEEAEGMMPR